MKRIVIISTLTISLLTNIILLVHLFNATKTTGALNAETTIVKTDWTVIEHLFHSNPWIIKECYQDHKLGVGVKIDSNIILQAQEPEIDKIRVLAQQSQNKNIVFLTE